MTITYSQIYCTAAELDSDLNLIGSVKESLVMEKILAASEYLRKQIGLFIPVTDTKYFDGSATPRLYLPPFLAITGTIITDDVSLTTSDYVLRPNNRFWENGPYGVIDLDVDEAHVSYWVKESHSTEIPARWGLYELTADTGATVADTTQQSAVQITLKVNNGALVSPGMVLLIGSEQQEVASWGSVTASLTTASAMDANVSEITLAAASVYPGEIIRIGLEQMKVLDNNSTLYYVQRGWNKTKQVAHSTSAAVDVYRTVNVVRGVNGTTAAAHLNGVSISRYKVPDDINYLCRQIAGLMLKKAQGGFAGKTGNDDLGTVTYNNEFPMVAMKEIAGNYKIWTVS